MGSKVRVICNFENVLIIFTTNIKNANRAIFSEASKVTMRIKINNQINEKYIMKKKRDVLLAKSKLNQEKRN